jgi:hypothetical protein
MNKGASSRGQSSGFRLGQILWLPPGSSWLNRDKARPFALVAAPATLRNATLAYGSTRAAEKSLGAACIQVAPQREGVNRNGLSATTQFYPGILLRKEISDLPPPAGTLGRSTESLKTCLRRALGIDQGSCLNPDAPHGSRRGRIVELRTALSRDVRARFAVLLTEAEYSRRKNYQIILPMIPGDGKAAGESVLRISERDWMSVYRSRPASVLMPISAVQSAWYGVAVFRETSSVMDEPALTEIDRRLCEFFALAPPGAPGEPPDQVD